MKKNVTDESTLRAALVGYAAQMESIQTKVAKIQALLQPPRRAKRTAKTSTVKKQKRRISAAGREAIRKAQVLRWKKIKAAAKTAKKAAKAA